VNRILAVLSARKWRGKCVLRIFFAAPLAGEPYFTYLLIARCFVPLYGLPKPFVAFLLGLSVAFFVTGCFSGYAAITTNFPGGNPSAAAKGLSYNVGGGLSALAPSRWWRLLSI